MTTNENPTNEPSKKELAAKAILDHFSTFAVIPDAPEHSEKTEDQLIELGFSGKITREEYQSIMKWKKSQEVSPMDAHKALIDALIGCFSKAKRSASPLSAADNQNKFVIEKVGNIYTKVKGGQAIKGFIKSQKLDPRTFRKNFKTNEEFFGELVRISGGEEKLKKILSK